MPQSLSRILAHLIFSTKNRDPVLIPAIREELHPYLAGIPAIFEAVPGPYDERYVWD
jgi:hypothetical protein